MTTDTRHIAAAGAAMLLVAFLCAADIASAATGRVSSSVGYARDDAARQQTDETAEIQQDSTGDKYLSDFTEVSKSRETTRQSASYSGFWIYDADARLYIDEDYDGFFSGLDVSFDVDTDHFAADVYARLYLSLEGGPWIQYFTTDVFTVFSSSGTDDYVVETDLLEGYPTGYYDLLIELYDYDTHEHVASFGPFESSKLSVLPLEDLTRELGYYSPPVPPVSHSSGGGGSIGFALLILALFVVTRRRMPFPESGTTPRR